MNHRMNFATVIVFIVSLGAHGTLPEPYRSIQTLPLDEHGWFLTENQLHLREFIEKYQPAVVVELGTWLGRSAIFMAQLLKDNGVLYAVDNWTAHGDTSILDSKDESIKKKIPTLYQQFLSNVIHKKLSHKIVPVRMDTLEAARSLNVKADLIYVDASHDEESVFNDIMNWYPKLNIGGTMAGDDALCPGVMNAAVRAAHLLNLTVRTDGNFWYFEPQKVLLEVSRPSQSV